LRPTADNESRAQYTNAVRRTRRRLEAEGFNVYVEPGPLWSEVVGDSVEALAGYRPDIVAVREPNELVIVEIRSRGWVGAEPRLEKLQDRIRYALPIARLVVVVAGEEPAEEAPSDRVPLDRVALHGLLAQAHEVSRRDSPELGIVLACAAVEGALRHVAPSDVTKPQEMLRWSAIEGPVERSVYAVLRHAFRFRNAYIHGRQPESDLPDPNDSWAAQTIGAAETAVTKLVDEDWPRPPTRTTAG
jgi:hypothetical protein